MSVYNITCFQIDRLDVWYFPYEFHVMSYIYHVPDEHFLDGFYPLPFPLFHLAIGQDLVSMPKIKIRNHYTGK